MTGCVGLTGMALVAVVAAATLARTATARAETSAPGAPVATAVDLYTMGSGNDPFEAFGHGALCVTSARFPEGACYNYGVTDFSNLTRLTVEFLRGRAKFWVARGALQTMLDAYRDEDRTIYRQRLPLAPAAAESLAAQLERDLAPDHRFYTYHHYRENCTTRLRDHIDAVTDGGLRRGGEAPYGATFRQLSRQGFAGELPLLLAVDLILGEPADAPATVWQAMFLPSVLRDQVQRQLGVVPEVINSRRGYVPSGDLLLAQYALWMLALALTLLALPALGRRRWPGRIGLAITGLVTGLGGIGFYAMALLSVMPELRRNELMLVFLPLDLGLIFLGGRVLFGYLCARLALVVVVAAGLAAGILVQPIAAPLAVVGAPMLIHAVGLRRARLAERALLASGGEVIADGRAGAPQAATRRGD
jgi:uncharacterized protein DUF4105